MSRKYKVVDRTEQEMLEDDVFSGNDEYEQAGIEERYPSDVKSVEPSGTTHNVSRANSWSS